MRMNDAAKAYGMIPVQHCCGYCRDLMEDFIDEGAVAWQAARKTGILMSEAVKQGRVILNK